MECLADRFLLDDKRWIDAATGAPVRLHFEAASPVDAFDWDEQCGRLFNARHPLLNSLIDYGPAPDGRRFEAYENNGAIVAPTIAGERLMLHLIAFLTTAGITLPAARSRYAIRPVVAGVAPALRPLAITLQPRRALDAARETLETPTAAPSIINLVGPPFAGLRTARTLVARTARLLGFVPVCSALLARKPEVADGLRDRHLCVFAEEDVASREALATILVRLASASARRHVIVRLTRTRAQRRAIVLDPLSIRALVGMVFVEPGHGPAEQELFDAARIAEGRPGAFLTYLAATAATPADGAMVVHETPQEYSVEVRGCDVTSGTGPWTRGIGGAPCQRSRPRARRARTSRRGAPRARAGDPRSCGARPARRSGGLPGQRRTPVARPRTVQRCRQLLRRGAAPGAVGSGCLASGRRPRRSLDRRPSAHRSGGGTAGRTDGRGNRRRLHQRVARACRTGSQPRAPGPRQRCRRHGGGDRLARRRPAGRGAAARGALTQPRGHRSNGIGNPARAAGAGIGARLWHTARIGHRRPGIRGSHRRRRRRIRDAGTARGGDLHGPPAPIFR